MRPAPTARRYAAPIALHPGYCALSALFSDWDRSGERDLRLATAERLMEILRLKLVAQ